MWWQGRVGAGGRDVWWQGRVGARGRAITSRRVVASAALQVSK